MKNLKGLNNMSNIFGGGNAKHLYIPLTEIEQEFISRLVETKDLQIVVHGWQTITEIRPVFGDKNLHLHFNFQFNNIEPKEVYFFDMELQTGAGATLYKEKMPCEYDGKPLKVCAPMILAMAWDISINMIDPKLIKALMPNVIGLTSRRIDKDSGFATIEGNMKLDAKQKFHAYDLMKREQKLNIQRKKKVQARTSKTR